MQGEGEAAADVESEVEAFADRSSGGMAMDSLHRHHAGVWERRTCQALPDLDKTSQALEKACVACTDDLQVAEEIKSAFSELSFSAQKSQSGEAPGEPGDEGEGEGEEEEEEGAEKAAAAESSVAMALFCLHFMYRIAVTEQCRLSCKLELERNLIAEWGTGVALRRIADGAPM